MANQKVNVLIHRYDTPKRYLDGEEVEWRVSLQYADGSVANTGREFSHKADALVFADGILMALRLLDCDGTVVTQLATRIPRSNKFVYEPIEL